MKNNSKSKKKKTLIILSLLGLTSVTLGSVTAFVLHGKSDKKIDKPVDEPKVDDELKNQKIEEYEQIIKEKDEYINSLSDSDKEKNKTELDKLVDQFSKLPDKSELNSKTNTELHELISKAEEIFNNFKNAVEKNQNDKNKDDENTNSENKFESIVDKFRILESQIRDYASELDKKKFGDIATECLNYAENISSFISPFENIKEFNEKQIETLNKKYNEFVQVFAKLQYKENIIVLNEFKNKSQELIEHLNKNYSQELLNKLVEFKNQKSILDKRSLSIKTIQEISKLEDLSEIQELNQSYHSLINEMEYEKYRLDFNKKIEDIIANPDSQINEDDKKKLNDIVENLNKAVDNNIKNNVKDDKLLDKTKNDFDNLLNQIINKNQNKEETNKTESKKWTEKLEALIKEINGTFIPDNLNNIGTQDIKNKLVNSIELNKPNSDADQQAEEKYNSLSKSYNNAKRELTQYNTNKESLETTKKILENEALKYTEEKYKSLVEKINEKVKKVNEELENLSSDELIKTNLELREFISTLPNKVAICDSLDNLKQTIEQANSYISNNGDTYETNLNKELNVIVIASEEKYKEFLSDIFSPSITSEIIDNVNKTLQDKLLEVKNVKEERNKSKELLEKKISELTTYKDKVLGKDDKSKNMYADLISQLKELIIESNKIKDESDTRTLIQQIDNIDKQLSEIKNSKNQRDQENGLIKGSLEDQLIDAQNWIDSNFDPNSNNKIKKNLESVINEIISNKDLPETDNQKLNELIERLKNALDKAKEDLKSQNKAREELLVNVAKLENYIKNNLTESPYNEIDNNLGLSKKIDEIKTNINNYSVEELKNLNKEILELITKSEEAKINKDHEIALKNLNELISESKYYVNQLNDSVNKDRYNQISSLLSSKISNVESNINNQTTEELKNNYSSLAKALKDAKDSKYALDQQIYNDKKSDLNDKVIEALNKLVNFRDDISAEKEFKEQLKKKIDEAKSVTALTKENINSILEEIENKYKTLDELISQADQKLEYFKSLNKLKNDLSNAKEELENIPKNNSDSRYNEIKENLDKVIKEIENNIENKDTNSLKNGSTKLKQAVENTKSQVEIVSKENAKSELNRTIEKAKKLLDELKKDNNSNSYKQIIDELSKITEQSQKVYENTNNTSTNNVEQSNKLNQAIEKAQTDKSQVDLNILKNQLSDLITKSNELIEYINSDSEIFASLSTEDTKAKTKESQGVLESNEKNVLTEKYNSLLESYNSLIDAKNAIATETYNKYVEKLNSKVSEALAKAEILDTNNKNEAQFKSEIISEINNLKQAPELNQDDIIGVVSSFKTQISSLNDIIAKIDKNKNNFNLLDEMLKVWNNIVDFRDEYSASNSENFQILDQQLKINEMISSMSDKVLNQSKTFDDKQIIDLTNELSEILSQILRLKSDIELESANTKFAKTLSEAEELYKNLINPSNNQRYDSLSEEFRNSIDTIKNSLKGEVEIDLILAKTSELNELITNVKTNKESIDLSLYNKKINERKELYNSFINQTLSAFDQNNADEKADYDKFLNLVNAQNKEISFNSETINDILATLDDNITNIKDLRTQAENRIKYHNLTKDTKSTIEKAEQLLNEINEHKLSLVFFENGMTEQLENSINSTKQALNLNSFEELNNANNNLKKLILIDKFEMDYQTNNFSFGKVYASSDDEDEIKHDAIREYMSLAYVLKEITHNPNITEEELNKNIEDLSSAFSKLQEKIIILENDFFNKTVNNHNSLVRGSKEFLNSNSDDEPANIKEYYDKFEKILLENSEIPTTLDNSKFKQTIKEIKDKINKIILQREITMNAGRLLWEINKYRDYESKIASIRSNKSISEDYIDILDKHRPDIIQLLYDRKISDTTIDEKLLSNSNETEKFINHVVDINKQLESVLTKMIGEISYKQIYYKNDLMINLENKIDEFNAYKTEKEKINITLRGIKRTEKEQIEKDFQLLTGEVSSTYQGIFNNQNDINSLRTWNTSYDNIITGSKRYVAAIEETIRKNKEVFFFSVKQVRNRNNAITGVLSIETYNEIDQMWDAKYEKLDNEFLSNQENLLVLYDYNVLSTPEQINQYHSQIDQLYNDYLVKVNQQSKELIDYQINELDSLGVELDNIINSAKNKYSSNNFRILDEFAKQVDKFKENSVSYTKSEIQRITIEPTKDAFANFKKAIDQKFLVRNKVPLLQAELNDKISIIDTLVKNIEKLREIYNNPKYQNSNDYDIRFNLVIIGTKLITVDNDSTYRGLLQLQGDGSPDNDINIEIWNKEIAQTNELINYFKNK